MPHLLKHWFIYSLLIVIPLGMWLGRIESVDAFVRARIDTQIYVFVVLFCMAVTLPITQVWQTATRPANVLLALGVNSLLLPLLAWSLFWLQPTSPFSAGLVIVAVAPSTMASAAVWTRRAGGNDALCLIVTLITNGGCFLVVPFWIWLILGTSVPIDAPRLMWTLLWIALFPMVLGQALRGFQPIRKVADRHRTHIGMLAQFGILMIVLVGSLRTGPVLSASGAGLTLLTLAVVVLKCLLLHAVGLAAGWWGVKASGGRREDAIAAMFSGSQKTLPIAVDLSTSPLLLAAGMSPLAILPPLIYHTTQLIIDSMLIDQVRHSPPHN